MLRNTYTASLVPVPVIILFYEHAAYIKTNLTEHITDSSIPITPDVIFTPS
jgi:hypothetical protein